MSEKKPLASHLDKKSSLSEKHFSDFYDEQSKSLDEKSFRNYLDEIGFSGWLKLSQSIKPEADILEKSYDHMHAKEVKLYEAMNRRYKEVNYNDKDVKFNNLQDAYFSFIEDDENIRLINKHFAYRKMLISVNVKIETKKMKEERARRDKESIEREKIKMRKAKKRAKELLEEPFIQGQINLLLKGTKKIAEEIIRKRKNGEKSQKKKNRSDDVESATISSRLLN